MELYKKLLERIENGEPIYCNKSFAKDLQTIADKHHKQLNIASVDSRRELLIADLKKVNQPIITLLEIADYERAADYLLGKL